MRLLIHGLIVLFSTPGVLMQQDTYKAAVLEHAPRVIPGVTLMNNFDQNILDYTHYMQQAAYEGVQIIVFPEVGLTGWHLEVKSLDKLSTEVPDPADRVSPCLSSSHNNYAKFLKDLSCASKVNNIYSVVNLIEWRHEGKNNTKVYHNTNVAFDRNGVVIARYRKINLFNEPYMSPGHHAVSTFKTDFGVTFGMFICFDIVFKSPGADVLSDGSVTDIAYSTAWFSELPYFSALSVQHGYAKSNGVNLLVAGMNDPAERMGGSGIYLFDGRIAESYISGSRGSKLLVQNVPKISARKDVSNSCQGGSGSSKHQLNLEELQDINSFETMVSDLSLYTFKPLTFDKKEISETICSGTSKFCCSFNITVSKHSNTQPNYVYKLAAFHGVSQVSSTKTVGLSNCGLVACLNERNDSCGGRHGRPPTGLTFESISVKGTFSTKNSHHQPSTLNFDLKPSTGYMYCRKTDKDEVEISLVTMKPHDSILTFGIVGRDFTNDDKPVGQINSAAFYTTNIYIAFTISIVVFLQQD